MPQQMHGRPCGSPALTLANAGAWGRGAQSHMPTIPAEGVRTELQTNFLDRRLCLSLYNHSGLEAGTGPEHSQPATFSTGQPHLHVTAMVLRPQVRS